MVFCSNCGEPITGKFCGSCGSATSGGSAPAPTQSQAPPPVPPRSQADSLTGVTNAVRHELETTPQELKDKKYGQQQWGLFETDYQRRKGISTEDSLQEIEEFCRDGSAPRSKTSSGSGSSAKGGYGGSSSGYSSQSSSSQQEYGGSSGSSGKTGGSSGGSTSIGVGSFAPRGDAGVSYFQQYQSKESQKYKPGYKGEPPK